jgi:L-galactose dehydrogenase
VEYRQLGRTDLQVSVLGLGTGGANRLGQARHAEQATMRHLIHHALDLGINFIDTAPSYGDSETILGQALAGAPRDAYVLGTKLRITSDPKALRSSLESSLRKLRTDHVDVVYFHGLAPDEYDTTVATLMEPLRQLKRDGLTRFIGATERYEKDERHSVLERALDDDLFDVVMIGHNLISPSGLQRVMPLAQQKNVGVVVMCAVRTIIITPDMLRETLRRWKADGSLPKDAVPDDAPLDWVLGPGVATLADAAYKFAIESPAVSTVLSGTANPAHLDANVRAILGPPLPEATSRRLEDIFVPASRNVLLHAFHRGRVP